LVVQGGADWNEVMVVLYRVELTEVRLWLGCAGWN